MRIYIGGLGSSVREEDLEKTFTSPQLGTVQSVEIIRTKGRSFGYLEYTPASDKALAKLFSTYNGCIWKGGRIKLEKAREDYLSRLRREWTENAELEIKSSDENDPDRVHVLQKPKTDQEIKKLQLNIFFPKLRKIKSIPFKGTGKHKYSFQRVEIPPLPVHFCDCEEHCGPSLLAKRNVTKYQEIGDIADKNEAHAYGVNEDELNMMKSILEKLLEDKEISKSVLNEVEPTKRINEGIDSAHNLLVDDEDEEEQASDEDGLVINIVRQPSRKRVASFEDWGQKTATVNQDSLLREPDSSKRLPEKHGSNEKKSFPDKKRKQPIHENHSNDIISSKKKSRKGDPLGIINNPVSVNTQPTETKPASIQLSSDVSISGKSSWKDMTINKESTAFCISDILPNPNPEPEPIPEPEPEPEFEPEHDDQSNQDEDLSMPADAEPENPSGSEDKYARGPFWLQKSSWLQLVADKNNSAFSISQILPDVNFEKQEVLNSGNDEFSDLKIGIEASEKPHGGANKSICISPENQNSDALTEEPHCAGVDREKTDFESKLIVEEKDEASVPARVGNNSLLQSFRAVPEIVISETCPFMKSAASVKEWSKTKKAALSGPLKKDGKGKEWARART